MRKLQAINFIDAIIEASVIIVIPLLLVSRNVDVASIGLILAASPFAFLVFRLLFASLSDIMGIRKFFLLNSLSNAISTVAYLVASNPLGYSIGKIFEGSASASIWAVNRTAIRNLSKERDLAVDSAKVNGFRIFAYFAATLLIGYMLQLLSFESALVLLTVFGVANLFVSLTLKEASFTRRPSLRRVLSQLDVRKKPGILLKCSLVMSLATLAGSSLYRLVLPLHLAAQGFDYGMIGAIIAFQWLARGFSIFYALNKFSVSRLVYLGALLVAFSLAALPFAPPLLAFPLLMLFGLGMGSVEIMWEKMISHSIHGSKTVGSDIGIIHVLPSLASVISLGAGGFLIGWFGFAPLFVITAALYAAYLLLGLRMLNSNSK